MSNPNTPCRYIDVQTGREIIVYERNDVYRPTPAEPTYEPPLVYQQPLPPAHWQQPEAVPPGSSERKGRLAGTFFFWFIVSWIPCGIGLPGLTLLAWGVGAAYLLYRAVKGA